MFKRIYFFFLSYLVAMLLGQTLFMLWFFHNGISIVEILFYYCVSYIFVFFLYSILEGRFFSSKFAFLFGITASFLAVLVANFIPIHTYYIYLIAFLFALNNVFFWTIYNVLYFRYSEKEEHGFKSGLYFLSFPILGAVLSPLSGLIAEKLGFPSLFLFSLALYSIPFVFVFFLPNFNFVFKTREALKKIEHPLLVTFQGYIYMLTSNAIPIFTLFFITTPFKLGSFFGYLSIFAALAALFNSKISDKFKKRTSFFYIFATLNALSYIPLVFSKSFVGWQLFSGINNFTYNLTNPFNLTLTLDHAKSEVLTTMLGRELYLNFGRIALIIFALVIYYLTGSLQNALIYSALVPILYPILAYYKGVYIK